MDPVFVDLIVIWGKLTELFEHLILALPEEIVDIVFYPYISVKFYPRKMKIVGL